MLVLSRCKNESIIIGDDIEVIIADVKGGKVRLGITAPKSISVHRKEVYDDIHKEMKGRCKMKKTHEYYPYGPCDLPLECSNCGGIITGENVVCSPCDDECDICEYCGTHKCPHCGEHVHCGGCI